MELYVIALHRHNEFLQRWCILFAVQFIRSAQTTVIKQGPTNVAVVEGDPFSLSCITEAGYKVIWEFIPFYENSEAAPKALTNVVSTTHRGNGHHEISDIAQFARAGLYICQVEAEDSIQQKAAHVNVMSNLLCQNNFSRAVGDGKVVRLTCSMSFTGNGTLNIALLDSNSSVLKHMNYSFDSYQPMRILSWDVNFSGTIPFNYMCTATFYNVILGKEVASNIVQNISGGCSFAAPTIPCVSLDNDVARNIVRNNSECTSCLAVPNNPWIFVSLVLFVILIIVVVIFILFATKKPQSSELRNDTRNSGHTDAVALVRGHTREPGHPPNSPEISTATTHYRATSFTKSAGRPVPVSNTETDPGPVNSKADEISLQSDEDTLN